MKLGTPFLFAALLLQTSAFAQNLDLLTPDLVACTSANSNREGTLKHINVLIADAESKTVSISVRSKRTASYSRTNTIVSLVTTPKESVYELNRNTKDLDHNRATLTLDNEKRSAIYLRVGANPTSDVYKTCRAFAKGDYSAINIWIKNQLN